MRTLTRVSCSFVGATSQIETLKSGRNLANAARVLEGNPALMNLRLMQSLTAAQNAGNTLVLGMPGGFVSLKNGEPNVPPEQPTED